MKLFGKGTIEEIDQPEPNETFARIEINGKGKTRRVKALLVSRSKGDTKFKSEYQTSKSEIFAYHTALEALQKYADVEGLEIVSKTTNADIGYVRTINKRMR